LFQQLAGINAVVYYSTSVFRSAGIASDVAASALVGASNVFGWYFLFLKMFIVHSVKEGYCICSANKILFLIEVLFCCRNLYCFLLNGQTRKEKSPYHKL